MAMFLPPNVTAVIQPMDQNPIKITKLKYRNILLSNIVAQEGISVHELLQTHTIRDAILFLNQAWNEVPESVLKKAWSKILNWDDSEFDEEDDLPLSTVISSVDVYESVLEETALLLSKLGDSNVPIDEIEDWNADVIDENTEDVEEMECDEDDLNSGSDYVHPRVPYADATNAVNTLIKYCEQNVEHSNKHIANLIDLRTDIVKKQCLKPRKQCSLTDFFRPNA